MSDRVLPLIPLPTLQAWRLQDWPGYAVLSDGSVWSRRSRHGLTRRWHPLKPRPCGRGHACVTLYREGRGKTVRVAPLVLEVFVGPRQRRNVARHLNGDKTDNRLENLIWERDGISRGKPPSLSS